MTRKQAMAWNNLRDRLNALGISDKEVAALLRCERALQRWAERECGDGSNYAIERDETTGKPFNAYHGDGKAFRYPIRDMETAALKRAGAIAKAHGLTIYHQGDPRGCALYLIRPGDVPAGSKVEECYSRGLAVCL